MQEFLVFWENNHPDIITGWNTEFFDIPYLCNRIINLYDEEEVKRMLARAQYTPRPQSVQQQSNPLMDVAQAAGSSMLGKVGDAAMGKIGTAMTAPTMGPALGSMAMSALPMLAGAAVLGKVFKLTPYVRAARGAYSSMGISASCMIGLKL